MYPGVSGMSIGSGWYLRSLAVVSVIDAETEA